MDITEAALRSSADRLRAMYDRTHEYIGLLAPDGTLLEANRASLSFADSNREEVIGLPFWTTIWFRFTPGAPEKIRAAVTCAAAGEQVRMEAPIVTPSNEVKTFELSFEPIRNDAGEIIVIVAEGRDVTERRKTEQDLRVSEERLRLATDAAGLGIWSWDITQDLVTWENDWPYGFFGIDQSDGAINASHFKAHFLYPDDVAQFESAVAEVSEPGHRFHFVGRVRRRDGEIRWVEFNGRSMADLGGKVTNMHGTAADITTRKRAEEALIESERFNVAVLNSLPAEIAVLDREGRIIAVNGPWSKFSKANMGASPERAATGVDYLAVCRQAAAKGDDIARRTLEGIKGVIDGQNAEFQMEYPCHTPNRQRWFSLQVVRPQTEVGGAIVAHTDITERHRTEKLLIEQDSLLELIATGGPLDECLTALCAAVSRLNPRTRACVFLATADGGSFGRSISPALPAEFTRGIANAPMEEVGAGVCAAAALSGHAVTCANIAADQRWSHEWQKLCLSHDIHACHSAPVLNGDDRAVAVLTLYFDEAREPSDWEICVSEFGTYLASLVLERDRANAALREAKEAAEAANQAKDHFLAVLSHELRTPLTPVLMAVTALEQDPELRSDVRDDIAMIKRNVELETKLIDDLLDLSRITSGKVELKTEAVDLNEAVRNVCDICRPQLAEHHVHLKMELGQDVAAISGDPARLQQVLWNVLKNAVKFTPAQGTVRVTTARLGSGKCEVRVQDSGIGIPPDVLPRIFNAFEQGDAHITRQFGGLGLGLAISRLLVELHGGTIRAESEGPGKGATFVVELPGQTVSPANSPAAPDPDRQREMAQIRLLLVEDHPDTARTLARLLRVGGFVVTAVADVASALATAERDSFDVVLSDLGLPDGDGYEVMRAIRSRRVIPGIAMSGYGMDEDIRRSREAGFNEHLVKPVAVPELVAAIRRVTEMRQLTRSPGQEA